MYIKTSFAKKIPKKLKKLKITANKTKLKFI